MTKPRSKLICRPGDQFTRDLADKLICSFCNKNWADLAKGDTKICRPCLSDFEELTRRAAA